MVVAAQRPIHRPMRRTTVRIANLLQRQHEDA